MYLLQYLGIAFAVYLGLPFLIGSALYVIRCCRKDVQLETYPVANTLTHLLFSAFLVVALFLNALWAYVIAAIVYVIKTITMMCLTKEVQYASNVRTHSSTQQFLQQLRYTKPYISIFIRCWHIEVYYTTETHTDSNGHRHTHRQRHEREVTTYTETRYVQITGWYDQTPPLVLYQKYRYSRVVSLELGYHFDYYKNSGTIMDMMLADAYNYNRHRDARCNTTLQRVIPGLTQYNYLCQSLPLFMQKWFIIVALLLAFDCPLLLITRACTPHCTLGVMKIISMLPNAQPIQQQPVQNIQTPEIMTPEVPAVPDQIEPPIYSNNIDDISPPIMLMENTQPLFSNPYDVITPPQNMISI